MTSIIAGIFVIGILGVGGLSVSAQSVTEAERRAVEAEAELRAASGLVDEAVSNRRQIELQIAASISRLNDLSASLSAVASRLDRLESQLGFADIELANIQDQIEAQAVDAYMTLLGSPTLSLIGSSTVERALVVSTVVEDVVAAGRQSVSELFVRRRSLEDLRLIYLQEHDEYQAARAELDAEMDHLADLYAGADQAVSDAIRQSTVADEEYRAALNSVDLARLKDEERRRQEERPPATPPTTAGPTTSTTTSSAPPTTTPSTVFPPNIEQWRPLVSTYFPAHRVDEALKILRCESNGNPNALNPYSGAAGLFQFLRGTWNGLPTSISGGTYESGQVFDPVANTRSAAWLAKRYEELGQYYWQAWSCRRVL